jgi:hypothetical protein
MRRGSTTTTWCWQGLTVRSLLKTYYVDEEDRHWLLPSNSDYDAILLTEDTDVQFCGRMIWHVDSPRETTRNLREATNTWGRFFFV